MSLKGRRSKSGKPLLQGGIAPLSWIVKPPRIQGSFFERWFGALSEEPGRHKMMRQFDNHWEYESTIRDLNRNCSTFCQHDYSKVVEPHIHFSLFLWRELRVYGMHLNRVTEINRAFRNLSEAMSVSRTASQRASAATLQVLSAASERLTETHLETLRIEKDYWDKVFCLGAHARSYECGWESDIRKFPKMRNLSNSLEFPGIRQERNLDSIFQIRLGDLLREYVPNPYGPRLSLLTISRLVLLIYICAQLADEVDADLTIWGSDPHRHLTVDRTYETLRNAGLH